MTRSTNPWKHTGKRMLSFLMAFILAFSLALPSTPIATVYGATLDRDTYSALKLTSNDSDSVVAGKKVIFHNIEWYITSGSKNNNTITLFSVNPIWASAFNGISDFLDNQLKENGTFAGVAGAIQSISCFWNSSGQDKGAEYSCE